MPLLPGILILAFGCTQLGVLQISLGNCDLPVKGFPRTILLYVKLVSMGEEIFLKTVSFLSCGEKISTPIRQSNSTEIHVFRIQDQKDPQAIICLIFCIYTDLKQLL